MKILIVGDAFMLPSVLQKHFEAHLSGVVKDLEIRAIRWKFITEEEYMRKPDIGVREYTGSPEDLIREIDDVDVLVVHIAPVTAGVIEADRKLKIIGCTRGGPVNVDIQAATAKGIPVLYTLGRNADAVADFTLGLILSEGRNIARAHAWLKERRVWRDDFYLYELCGPELSGKTLGIVGFGSIGSKVANRASGFGMSVLVYDPYVQPETVSQIGGRLVDLKTLMRESDFITVHARLTEETRKLIDRNAISLMKPTAYLINTARGGIVDDAALYEALKNRKIAGAALDVFESEPLRPNDPFLELENVTVTPHISGASKETVERASQMISEDIVRILKGEKPRFIANPNVLQPK